MHRRRCRLTSAFCAFPPIIRKAIFKMTSLVASLYIPSRVPDVDTLQLEEIEVKPSQAVSSGTRGSDQTIVEYFLALTV